MLETTDRDSIPSFSAKSLSWLIITLMLIATALTYYHYAHIEKDSTNFYTRLGEGFLTGHTYIVQEPDPRLLALSDPYDPKVHIKYSFWDASLYKGHYYFYFGPMPALLPWMPVKLATGISLNDAALATCFTWVGTACLMWILISMAARQKITIHAGLLLALISLAVGTWIPFILRRPTVYEVAIAGAYCYSALGFLCLWYGLWQRERTSLLLLALASLCFGFAISCRLSHIFNAVVLAITWLSLLRLRSESSTSFTRLLALGIPWGLCIVGLLIYNYERFDSIFESGMHYQLTFYNPRGPEFKLMDLHRLIPNIYFYLLRPLHFNPAYAFPFFVVEGFERFPLIGSIEAMTYEPVYGLFVNSPFSLWLFAAPYCWKKRHELALPIRITLMSVYAYGSCMLLFMLFFFFSTTRYSLDFAPWLMFIACAQYLFVLGNVKSRNLFSLLLLLGTAMAFYGAFTDMTAGYCGVTLCAPKG